MRDDLETTAYRGLYCPSCGDLLTPEGWCPVCEPDPLDAQPPASDPKDKEQGSGA